MHDSRKIHASATRWVGRCDKDLSSDGLRLATAAEIPERSGRGDLDGAKSKRFKNCRWQWTSVRRC